MVYRGYIRNGQITLDQAAHLPEGAEVKVEVLERPLPAPQPPPTPRRRKIRPLEMPGPSLAEELVRERR